MIVSVWYVKSIQRLELGNKILLEMISQTNYDIILYNNPESSIMQIKPIYNPHHGMTRIRVFHMRDRCITVTYT